jgi:heme exporter protein C
MTHRTKIARLAAPLVVGILLAATHWLIFVFAPREATMGDVQRILYLHVAVAWCGLAGCLAMGGTAAVYLLRRDLVWDHWSRASGEIGWLCTTLTLATGSLWAHEAWNTWWTWEPRLTSSLVLWLMFAGYFLVRSSIADTQRRARISAVLAILSLADVPLVVMATRWFRGVHPVTPEMDPRMRLVLLVSVASFTSLSVLLAIVRRRQLTLIERVAATECRRGLGEWRSI